MDHQILSVFSEARNSQTGGMKVHRDVAGFRLPYAQTFQQIYGQLLRSKAVRMSIFMITQYLTVDGLAKMNTQLMTHTGFWFQFD